MSWSISFTANSKTEAVARLEDTPGCEQVPNPVNELLENAINALPCASTPCTINVSSYGHFDERPGQSSNITISLSTANVPTAA